MKIIKHHAFAAIISLLFFTSKGQDLKTSSIPDSLSEGMDAVIRIHEGDFEILSIDRAKYKVRKVVTVLNKNGSHNAYLRVFYDDLRKVNSLEANLYDPEGRKIEKIKKSDFRDESAVEGSYFDDSRVLWYDLRQDSYPYTVEMEYEIGFKYLYSIPDWYFLHGFDESTEYSSYTITSPLELKPRFRTKRAKAPAIVEENETFSARWEEENLPGLTYELYGPSPRETAPKVLLSPSKFEFEGFQGDMSTWDGIARWQNTLNEGRDKLPEATIEKIKKLTEGMTDEEKAKVVYEYMQSKTRYVSLQLGIGGFQPFTAGFVDEEGYGDCKALSFYTQTLLREVGVASYYTWVSAGSNPQFVDRDFPNDTFNHIILCLPNAGDTIWLECTNQEIPFGFLGDFTSDRDVFVVKEDGGEIVRTPKYGIEETKEVNRIEVHLMENGNAEVNSSTRYSGLKYDNMMPVVIAGNDDQKKWLERNIGINSISLHNFSFTNEKSRSPSAELEVFLSVRNLTSMSGTRIFLQPNLMNKSSFVPAKDESRKHPIRIKFPMQEIDSVFYTLPEGYEIEAIFDPISFESPFGSYSAELSQLQDHRLLYKRTLKTFSGEFDPDQYPIFADFYRKVSRSDKKRVSFKKKT